MSHKIHVSQFFTAGGTLPPNSPSYVQRPADDQLFYRAQAGNFCYVLTARQMGKSSLMVRTAHRLEKQQVKTAQIDLNDIGTVTADAWYLNLLTELERELRLSVDAEDWWQKQAALSPVQRFTNFLGEVVLLEIESSIVVFVDEIDTTLKLNFTDDFFVAIRAMHNRRAIDPVFGRLTFILLGAATPADLIKDHSRTPFNIGDRIDLREFSPADAQILSRGLQNIYPEQGQAIFNRIFDWTHGHPYLTQKLCLSVAESEDGDWPVERVDRLVERLLLAAEARNETNLRFVQNSVENVEDNQQRRQLLNIYRRVYRGKKIKENVLSPEQNLLQLFGLVRVEQGILQVRNDIYRRVFDLDWIKVNTPVDQRRRIQVRLLMVMALLILLLLGSAVLGTYTRWQREEQAQVYENSFNSSVDPTLRLNNLANLFEMPGYDEVAHTLFNTLTLDEKIQLFDNATPDLQPQVREVVKGTYTYLADTEPNNQILQAMQTALNLSEDAESIALASEVGHWLNGRTASTLEEAKNAYNAAIELNNRNPATYFERALILTALRDNNGALTDLEHVLSLNKHWQDPVRQTVESNNQLHTTLWGEKEAYPALVRSMSPPELSPALVSTPTTRLGEQLDTIKKIQETLNAISTPIPTPILPSLIPVPDITDFDPIFIPTPLPDSLFRPIPTPIHIPEIPNIPSIPTIHPIPDYQPIYVPPPNIPDYQPVYIPPP